MEGRKKKCAAPRRGGGGGEGHARAKEKATHEITYAWQAKPTKLRLYEGSMKDSCVKASDIRNEIRVEYERSLRRRDRGIFELGKKGACNLIYLHSYCHCRNAFSDFLHKK